MLNHQKESIFWEHFMKILQCNTFGIECLSLQCKICVETCKIFWTLTFKIICELLKETISMFLLCHIIKKLS